MNSAWKLRKRSTVNAHYVRIFAVHTRLECKVVRASLSFSFIVPFRTANLQTLYLVLEQCFFKVPIPVCRNLIIQQYVHGRTKLTSASLLAPSLCFGVEALDIFMLYVMLTNMQRMVVLVLFNSSHGMSVVWWMDGIVKSIPRALPSRIPPPSCFLTRVLLFVSLTLKYIFCNVHVGDESFHTSENLSLCWENLCLWSSLECFGSFGCFLPSSLFLFLVFNGILSVFVFLSDYPYFTFIIIT